MEHHLSYDRSDYMTKSKVLSWNEKKRAKRKRKKAKVSTLIHQKMEVVHSGLGMNNPKGTNSDVAITVAALLKSMNTSSCLQPVEGGQRLILFHM